MDNDTNAGENVKIDAGINAAIDGDTDTVVDFDTGGDAGMGTADAAAAAPPVSKPVLYARFPRSFGFEFIMAIFFCPPLIVLWAFVAYYYYLSGTVSLPILKVAALYSAAVALAVFLYGNNRAARQGRGVVLDGERIVKKGSGGVGMILYEDIRGVCCSLNPLFNKKMVVTSTMGRVMLPLNLSGGYKMVETVFEKLSALGLFRESGNMAEAAKRRLHVTAVQYNALYKVRERYMHNFITVMAAAAFFNGLVAALYWERELTAVLVWGLAGMLFQVLGYFAAERFWAWRRFDRVTDNGAGRVSNLKDVSGLYESFKSTYAAAAVIALLICMVAGIAVTAPPS